MSEQSARAQSLSELAGGYSLSSDLARLSLPATYRDQNRTLAWVNSICLLFLVIGIIGLKRPRVIERPLTPPPEIVPVVWTPPPEQPKVEPEIKPDEPVVNTPVDVPQVTRVAAVADAASVAFPVPVENAVVVAEARAATPPPPVNQPSAPIPKRFVPGSEPGNFPEPTRRDYPRQALEIGAQGKVLLYVEVDEIGVPVKVQVKETSKYVILDKFAAEWVRNKYRWLPGPVRYRLVSYEFRLE